MDGVDATDRHISVSRAPPASLLVIIIDTNPVAWAELSASGSAAFSKSLAHLQIFINAHLATNHGNQVAVLASHVDHARWLYPPPADPAVGANGSTGSGAHSENGGSMPKEDQSKYRPFLTIEHHLYHNLQRLMSTAPSSHLTNTSQSQLAAALTAALAYSHKQTLLSSPNTSSADPGPAVHADGTTTADAPTLTSRILVLSVSGDVSAQYISAMNAIFAAQRRRVPIDCLKLAGDAGFLQQACDTTGGVYLEPKAEELKGAGLLQTLMMGFLPDAAARASLVVPGHGEVDFRAACFCHTRFVDLGFVCSVCLSIFCEPPPDSICLTCSTTLELPAKFNVKPAVLPRRKKKKRAGDVSGAATPSRSATPGQ